MPQLRLQINGQAVQAEIAPTTLLVDFIRRGQRLTGTHVGCDTAQCGACTVLVDGAPVKSCSVLALQVDGSAVTTIEGLAPPGGGLHPVQEAFVACHGLQCGYCTPGMVMCTVGPAGAHAAPERGARSSRRSTATCAAAPATSTS